MPKEHSPQMLNWAYPQRSCNSPQVTNFNSMIFKTITSSVDETRKTLALFNKDWNTYKTNWQNANGVFGKIGSVFTPANAITKSDIEAIKAYNSQIDSCVTSQTAFNRTMLNASPVAQNLVASYNGGKVSAQGMATAQNAAKASTIGLTIAQTALNAAIGMGIGLLISLVVKGIDKLVHANEEAIEKAEELRRKYEEFKSTNESNISTLNGLKKEFEELSKGVSQYGDNISLTTEQYERYKEIIQQIVGMSPSLAEGYSTENGYIADKNGLLERAIELQEQEYRNELRKITNLDNLKTSMSGYIAKYKEAFNGGLVTDDMSATVTREFTDLKNAIYEIFNTNNRSDFSSEDMIRQIMSSIGIEDIEAEMAKYYNKYGYFQDQNFWNDYADVIAQNIQAITNSLNADVVGLDDTVFDQNTEKVDSAAQSYLDMKDAISMANESIQRDLGYIAEYADGYSNLSTEQQKFVNEFLKGYDISDIMSESNNPFDQGWKFDEDKMASVKSQITKFVEALSQDETTKSALADLYAIPTDEQSISEFVEQFRNALEIIKAYCQENGIEIPIAITDSEQTINNLEAQYQRAVDFAKDKFDGYDPTAFFKEHSINTQEEIDKWRKITDEVETATEAEEKYLAALEPSDDTPISFTDFLSKLDDNAIDNYQKKLSTLKSYLEKFKNGTYSSTDITTDKISLATEFGIAGDSVEELTGKIQDLIDVETDSIIKAIDKILNDENLSEDTRKAVESLRQDLISLGDEAKNVNISKFLITGDALSDTQRLVEGLDLLKTVFEDVSNKEDFDYSNVLNNDSLTRTFGAYTEQFENFKNVIVKSPNDINKCRDAFNQLVDAYIKGSGVLSEVTEEYKDTIIVLLEQKGVINAQSIVEYALTEKHEILKYQTDALKAATYDMSTASVDATQKLLEQSNMCDTARKALLELVTQETIFSNNDLNIQNKIDKLQQLTKAYLGLGVAESEDFRKKIIALTVLRVVPMSLEEAYDQVMGELMKESPNTSGSTYKPPTSTYKPTIPTTSTSSSSSKSETKEKTPLEKFQEWIGKFFDWVEIKIKRKTEEIDRYLTRAEKASDEKKYGESANYYSKALNATTDQIKNQQAAYAEYNKQADTVIKKAVSIGVVSKKQADIIKKQVKDGSMNISEYGDEVKEVIKDYQEWYDKSKEASDAIEDLHYKTRTYIKDLKDMRDAQREAKLDKINTYTSIGTSGYANTAYAQNSQLKYSNSQLRKQDKAYQAHVSETIKDVNNIAKSGTGDISKALKSKDATGTSKESKAYKKALSNAQKAIKNNEAVSDADLNTIISHSVSLYNKLYAYNLSLENLEIARLENATNIAATSAERLENIAKIYENKDNKTNDKISLLQNQSKTATSIKKKNNTLDKIAAQYDLSIKNDKLEISEYKKQKNSSSKQIKNKAGTGSTYKNLSKKNKNEVKKYINKAKNAAKSGKSISASVISKLAEFCSKGYVSDNFYDACINYNNAIEHQEEAKAQLEIDKQTAIQEKAAIGTEKFNNVEQKYQNKQAQITSNRNKESIRQSIKSTKGHTLSVQDYQKMINYSQKEQQSYTSEIKALNKIIEENLNSGYWTTASQEYIDAINSVRGYQEEVLNCKLEQEELNNEIAQLPYTIIEKAVSLIQSVRSNFQSLLSIKVTRGVSKTTSDLLDEIGNVNAEIEKQTEKKNQLWEDYQKAISNGGAYGGKDSNEWLEEYYNVDTAINNLKNDVESLNNEIAQLPYEKYEKALSLLDSMASYNKSIANLTKAYGKDLSESDYLTEINYNNAKINEYENERIQAYGDYIKALSSYDGVYGGMTSDEWLAKYNDLGSTINKLKSDNEDIRDALRDDVYWRTFERAHKSAQALKNILSGIADLIDDAMLYDKDGNFTQYGIAQMSNIVKQYETARKEVQNYTNDIQNLNSLYAHGYYNQDEYNEKLKELQSGLLDAASAMKSYVSVIIDMNKKLAQSELDALFKLIDARNEALASKKSYYDYDKTIKDKTKDIQSLQAQIAALKDVETAEAKAQKARLEADLADKKDDLNDTIINHSFELSKNALDELKTILQDEFDEKWDHISQNLEEIQKLMAAGNELVSSQSYAVGSALNKLLSFYGIDPVYTEINQFGNITGYASGTKGVDKNKVAWTQENGGEIIIRKSDGAILTPLKQGDSVIPNGLSDHLFEWGKYRPNEFADNLATKLVEPNAQAQNVVVEQHFDNLLNVEGNVDSTVVTDLEKFAKSFYQGAYKYTVSEIARDARKKGIKV